MEVFVEGNDQAVVLRIVGEVVAQNCAELRTAVMDVLPRKPRRIILNLAEVPFMDTSGIGVLIGVRATLKSKGTALEVDQPSRKVRQVFTTMRLAAVFGIPEE